MGTLARLGLAAVWLVSGALKISAPGQTYIAVQAFDVLPDGLVRPVAIGMPLVELALGLFLLAGFVTRWVSVLSVLLLAVLIAAIAQSWARGLSIDCGCFGGGGQIAADQTRYPQEIARDLGFALLGVWLIVRPRTWLSVDGWLGNSRASADDDYVGIAEGNE
ncbi:DoxX family protein [Amycolatopsis sp. MJM2582]|uniref:MauE/DoxX family redox-associated membrane protein n=1 Tax=Amycolatopsis TaxID=1813 RepID=UPI0005082EDF|nr:MULTISPECIES: MauE/DoxX family redox-associated membrane protein [unclassified Amycolatopsis]KFZ77213.1 DoxX family protein [Amycolatopsis sp. MJM2582]RSN43066.1 DoxX family membrane protein [Amycolatopsis sp. WAC 04197]